jgi:hypothetical protein
MSTTHKNNAPGITKIYQLPEGITPWAKQWNGGNVWFSMKPKRIIDQYSKGGNAPIKVSDPQVEFLFLAPLSIGEHIIHHWEAYESVASRLAQKARSLIKFSNEINAGKTAIGQKLLEYEQQLLAPEAKENSVSSPTKKKKPINTSNLVSDAFHQVPGHSIDRKKIDTPLYYTNSDRRQLILEFNLFAEMKRPEVDSRPEKHLLEPIQEMMKYSSPGFKDGLNIDFPYMWEVKTEPYPFINYKTCVLQGVQPTWNSPYVRGLPISCNLQLTFQDLSPLYASTIEKGTIINVIDNDESRGIRNKSPNSNLKKKPKENFLGRTVRRIRGGVPGS